MDNTADMLARIRNSLKAKKQKVNAIYSKKNMSILYVLKEEGYIEDFKEVEIRKNIKEIIIFLKYKNFIPAISFLKLRSKFKCREYSTIKNLDLVYNGLGIAIISTSKGVMSDHRARNLNIGGEVICEVF